MKQTPPETLGHVLDPNEIHERDAVHVAVIPATAAQQLKPGQHVAFTPMGHAFSAKESVGIVDPFLVRDVAPGERFWIFVYPRTTKSVRHVWTHPVISDEPTWKEREIARQVVEKMTPPTLTEPDEYDDGCHGCV